MEKTKTGRKPNKNNLKWMGVQGREWGFRINALQVGLFAIHALYTH